MAATSAPNFSCVMRDDVVQCTSTSFQRKEATTLKLSGYMKRAFSECLSARHGRYKHLQNMSNAFRRSASAAEPVIEESTEEALSPPEISGYEQAFTDGATAKIVAVVEKGSISPFDGVEWEEVMRHMARRINWIDPGYEMLIFLDAELNGAAQNVGEQPINGILTSLKKADILLVVEIQSEASVEPIGRLMDLVKTSVYLGKSQELLARNRLGGLAIGQLSAAEMAVMKAGFWPKASESFKVMKMVTEAWGRENPDDVWFAILALVNAYVKEVPMLQNLRAQDFSALQCMVSNCGSQILACLSDPSCRKAIGCLNSCGPTDQVCSYRCIVSYESPQLEAFSLCILQKHNCLGLDAEIRMRPDVQPMAAFRGEPLTHELAESIFIGWLGKKEYSWRVVAGQNAAYDQFPCQYQIFYRGKARGSFWYDPVFMVRTLDGDSVWRRRHYRVKRAAEPGTFWFSVLDNGVTSREFWRVVHVADDFSWALFYYSGAASAAGQSYTGAVLLTEDGLWPGKEKQPAVEAALERCGIKVWELFRVDNSSCQNPPLGLPADAPPVAGLIV